MDHPTALATQSRLERFIGVCERFELAWKAGHRPTIETYLVEADDCDRTQLLLDLLVIELQLRGGGREPTCRDDYRRRFPSDAAVVEEAFDVVDSSEMQATGDDPGTTDGPSGGSGDEPGTRPEPAGTSRDLGTLPSSRTIEDRMGSAPSTADDPPSIGRYAVIRRLGEGSFGRVYLARDDELDRHVAIKVPRRQAFGSAREVELMVNESRVAAQLRHPGIVAVYDVGRQPDGSVYIVLEYVDGRPLSEVLETDRYPLERPIGLLASVAEAIHHAHKHGLVHRDLKPANILVDTEGHPRVADFGLAMREGGRRSWEGEIAGTAAYMAPEQIEGETHRLDGRTDVWALGVILYTILAGRKPFSGTLNRILDDIRYLDPRPPRQFNEAIPGELQRICLKCLSKRMTDRYNSALDLAEDLRAWLRPPRSADAGERPAAEGVRRDGERRDRAGRIGPKGLRVFDRSDADGFLDLLPGPRDRDGLPQSVSFWKARIEDRGAAGFSVGLLYGPSGSGKTSVVRAGILPRLDELVYPIYLEASPGQTEAQLAAALGRRFPGLSWEGGLVGAMARIREGEAMPPGVKVLLVLDQFEQHLQGHPDEPQSELVRALRQCDGRRLQALILVRDDFWMATTRLFKALEVPLVERVNSAPVELFDASHARKVLVEFGHACVRLAEGPEEPGSPASRFLDRAIEEMTGPDGRVMPVRLSLFAEMVRRRPWTPATLRELGGVEGIGVTFLKEAFDSPSSPPQYKAHRAAAHRVLRALLPAPTSTLRGGQRCGRDLIEAAGYSGRPDEFADLMRILDNELRMVTPVDSGGAVEGNAGPAIGAGEACYQLAHDFLIGPIRQWVEEEEQATPPGRARHRLAIITAAWVERPSSHRLPSLLEWAGILRHTRPGAWSVPERRMMRTASRHYLTRLAATVAAIAIASFAVVYVREGDRAAWLLERALKADYRHLPALLPELDDYRGRLREPLERLERGESANPRDRGVAAILLYRDRPRAERARALRDRLRVAGPDELILIRDALATHLPEAGIGELKADLLDGRGEDADRLRVACTLAALTRLDDGAWVSVAEPLARAILAEDRSTVPRWLELLGPAAPVLVPVLGRIGIEEKRDSSTRSAAAESLAEILAARGDAAGLARSLVEAQPDAALVLLRQLEKLGRREPALARLREVLAESPAGRGEEEIAARQARAAVVLAVLGEPEALRSALRHAPDPRLRTETIQAIATLRLAHRVFDDRFDRAELDSAGRQAVLLAWAETAQEGLPSSPRERVVGLARELYVGDPDPGVHSAAELLLRRWGAGAPPVAPRESPARPAGPDGRGWELGPNGHTMVILPGPLEFTMGSPLDEPDRFPYENRHERRIGRSLAVATTEVTIEQFRAFKPDYKADSRYAREPGCPAGRISWYDAMRYCNWLSRVAGIDRGQWCYPVEIGPESVLPADLYERTGFRLPSEAEWEYFARAGTATSRSYGDSEKFLSRYAWTWLNSQGRVSPSARLLPNELGLFDTLGSLWEWCQDGPQGGDFYPSYPSTTPGRPAPDPFRGMPRNDKDWRIVRGGDFDATPAMARSAHRDIFAATSARYFNGLRVVRTLPRPRGAP